MEYHDLHVCEACADAAQATPMQFSLEFMGISRTEDAKRLIGDYKDAFNDGWEVGIEGSSGAWENGDLPWGLIEGEVDAIRAWVIGLVTGVYAGAYGYGTPYCKSPGIEGHQVI